MGSRAPVSVNVRHDMSERGDMGYGLDLHPDKRHRIKPREGSGVDSWFRFDRGGVESAAQQVLGQLPSAEAWWGNHA